KVWFTTLIIVIAAVLAVVFSRPISEWMLSTFFSHLDEKALNEWRPVVASVDSIQGSVAKKTAGRDGFTKIKANTELVHLDQIKTEQDGRVTVTFLSGWALEFLSSTVATIELYQPDDPDSAILVSFTRGDYRVTAK